MHQLDIRIDWKAFVAGDERIFDHVYNTFFDVLYNYGCKYTSNRELVEDAVQDLFVRFWKNRASLNEPPSLKNYLFKAFRNHMNDRLKADGRYIAADFGEQHMFEAVPSPEAVRVAAERVEAKQVKLAEAMTKLTDRQREAIFLRFYEGFSYPDIAELMGITVKATYKLMARSIDTIRDSLGRNSIDVFLILVKMGTVLKN